MDYQVAFFQDSWDIKESISSDEIIKNVLDTRDEAMKKLRVPGSMDGKVDQMSYGVWLKVRTDRPQLSSTTTAFTSISDGGLHRPMPFSYLKQSLKATQIRLLELQPGKPTDLLCGRLIVVDLHSAPAYEALSYTWGNTASQATMQLDHNPFRITANLQAALTALRHDKSSRLLWIDAVCTYSYRTAMKHLRNLRFEPLFSDEFDFAYILGPIHTYELV